jgi:hypothetical protein
MGAYLTGVDLIWVYFINVHLIGVHLMLLNDFADFLQSAYLCIVSLEKIP